MRNAYMKLKGALLEKGFTYKQMAQSMGISYASFVSKINKKTQFTLDETKEIKDLLELSVEQYADIFLN